MYNIEIYQEIASAICLDSGNDCIVDAFDVCFRERILGLSCYQCTFHILGRCLRSSDTMGDFGRWYNMVSDGTAGCQAVAYSSVEIWGMGTPNLFGFGILHCIVAWHLAIFDMVHHPGNYGAAFCNYRMVRQES